MQPVKQVVWDGGVPVSVGTTQFDSADESSGVPVTNTLESEQRWADHGGSSGLISPLSPDDSQKYLHIGKET